MKLLKKKSQFIKKKQNFEVFGVSSIKKIRFIPFNSEKIKEKHSIYLFTH